MKNLKTVFLWMMVFSCFVGESDTHSHNSMPPLISQAVLPDEGLAHPVDMVETAEVIEVETEDQEFVDFVSFVFDFDHRVGELVISGLDTTVKWFFPKDPLDSVLYDILPDCLLEISLEYYEHKPRNRTPWWNPLSSIRKEILSLPACRRWILQEEEKQDETAKWDDLWGMNP